MSLIRVTNLRIRRARAPSRCPGDIHSIRLRASSATNMIVVVTIPIDAPWNMNAISDVVGWINLVYRAVARRPV